MGRPAGWMRQVTGRGPMRSPGAPPLRREIERLFWRQIATGITSERAAQAVGVSQPITDRRALRARLDADQSLRRDVFHCHISGIGCILTMILPAVLLCYR